MQRSQSGNEISDSPAKSSNPLGGANHELYSRTLLEVLDDAIEERDPRGAALLFLEYFERETAAQDTLCLLCERAGQILADAGRARGAARIWEQVATYWMQTGQPARAIAALLRLEGLSAPSEVLRNAFSALYNIRSPYLDLGARIRAVQAPRESLELSEAKLQQMEAARNAAEASAAAHEQLFTEVLARALDAPGVQPAEPASLPPMALLSLLPAPALSRVLEHMTLRQVVRGEDAFGPAAQSAGLFWTIDENFCIENQVPDADAPPKAKTLRSRVPSGALLGLNSVGPSAQAQGVAVTSCSQGELLGLSASAIEALDGEFGDFLNRLTTLRRHALSEGFLENHSLFLQVEPAQRAELMRRFCGVRVGEGEVLIAQGGTSAGIYLVLDGQVDVICSAQDTKHTVEILRAGQVFGAVSVVSNRGALANFVMSAPGHVLFLPTAKFVEAAGQMPGIAKYAVKLANARIQRIDAALSQGARAQLNNV